MHLKPSTGLLNGRTFRRFLSSIFVMLAFVPHPTFAINSVCGGAIQLDGLASIEKKYSGDLSFDQLIESFENGFPDLQVSRNFWLSYPKSQPRTQELVEKLIGLTPGQRIAALDTLARHPPQDLRLRSIVMLALYDRVTWRNYVERFISGPLLNDAIVNSLIPVLRAMPLDLKRELLEQIRKVYPDLSKRNFTWLPPRKDLRLAPKRSADAFINHVLEVEKTIIGATASGRSPEEGLQLYFDLLQSQVFGSTFHGRYNASDVLNIARIFQRGLRQSANIGTNPEVIVTGSFPNGRSDIRDSDIDAQISDSRIKDLFPSIQVEIKKYMKKFGGKSNLVPSAMRSTTTLHFAAQINPVQIRITRSSIEILVYSPFSPLNGDKVLPAYNYQQPTRLLVEGEAERGLAYMVGSWLYPVRDQSAKIHRLLSNFPNEFKKDFLEKLVAGDHQAWLRYVDRLMEKPVDDDALLNLLVPVMESLSKELKDKILQKISTKYNILSKDKKTRPFPWLEKVYMRLAPKRAIDVVLTHILHPLKTFERSIQNGDSVIEALQRHFDLLDLSVFVDRSRGHYAATEVIDAATEIQNVLRKRAGRGYAGEFVLMSGSFPGGRANIRDSDIDLIVSNHDLEKELPVMQEKVNAKLRVNRPDASLEVHSMLPVTTVINAALINPLFVRVTATDIEIVIYPPFQKIEGDEQQLERNYPPPFIYKVDEAVSVEEKVAS